MATVWGLELVSGGETEYGMVREFPEASAMSANTFRYMYPVKLTTSGTVEDALDTENLFGFALAPSTGTANTAIPVLIATRDMLFSASQSNAGATQASAQTQVGLQCSWILSTQTGHTTKITIDTADTGNLNFEIIDLDGRDDAATTDGRVIVRIVPDVISAR